MNDSLVDRFDEQEPGTITEALEIPQPRAVGSPLPRGNGSRVSVPPTYADLEDRMPVSHPGPVLAPPPSNFSYNSPMLSAAAPVQALETVPLPVGFAPKPAAPAPAAQKPVSEPTPKASTAAQERPRKLQGRSAEPRPSTLQRAALMVRHAIPIAYKLLPLLDGDFGTALTSFLAPPAPAAPPAAPEPATPARVDLTPINENIAELQTLHKDLRVQIVEQNSSLKRVEDHLQLVREATDRNTLEQQELLQDLKSMGAKVNVIAAIAIGLLAISLLVNVALYMHIQRVLP